MNINLKKIDINDGVDGLEVLKQIAITFEEESPIPKEIDEYLYKGFLYLAKEEENICQRYWIELDNKKIGYADIKYIQNDYDRKYLGNIGLIILKEYQKKGIGFIVIKLLIEKAKNEFNIDKVQIATKVDNVSAIKLCEKLGADLIDSDEKNHYVI